MKNLLKRFKPAIALYNFLHSRQLRHNQVAYRTFGLNKHLFESLSSKDFPDKTSRAWLDVNHSRTVLPNDPRLTSFPEDVQQSLLNWSDQGFLVWNQFFPQETIDEINKETDRVVISGKISITHDNKFPFLNRESKKIDAITRDPQLTNLLSLLLGKEVVPFQTLSFIKGSGQRAHSDSIHMTTYPLGYLIAVWIALEDVQPDSGPLFYFPGSHRLPYLLNDDFGKISSAWMTGERSYKDYEDVIEELIAQKHLEPAVFLPKAGDILVWHANLLHGGQPIENPARTRKSMVIHYYAKDVIKYHELTERPSLMT
jgi:ectoine hydroxylase-related dioxygenase (phytanoyl-CoA dioxygenase family)